MLEVSELFIYPIKSLGGISLQSVKVTDRGFEYDRRWMLVDSQNVFLTQREIPQMALLQVGIDDEVVTVKHKRREGESIHFPVSTFSNHSLTIQIWNDQCEARTVDSKLDEWFSDMLSFQCRLVYMPDSSTRRVDTQYAFQNEITSLSDGYPFLIIGQASLDDLNGRLVERLPINRFRPNLVFTGGYPFEEDTMEHFSINGIDFYGVKLCARCPIPNTNQDNAIRAKEPLKTLATYRQWDNKVFFGQNLLHRGEGRIFVGDKIEIHKTKQGH